MRRSGGAEIDDDAVSVQSAGCRSEHFSSNLLGRRCVRRLYSIGTEKTKSSGSGTHAWSIFRFHEVCNENDLVGETSK